MATLAVQTVVRTGLEATFAACDVAGDEFVNSGAEWIEIVNADVADKTVTIQTPNLIDADLTIQDRSVVVTAGETRLIGPFPTGNYNDGAGKVQFTYSAITSLTIALYKLG